MVYKNARGDIIRAGLIVEAIAQAKIPGRGWGIIERVHKTINGIMASVRDIDGRLADWPVEWIQPNRRERDRLAIEAYQQRTRKVA